MGFDEGIDDMVLGIAPLKLGQVPCLRCSYVVLDGLDAENNALESPHLNFTALATPMSWFCTRMGSMCTQYKTLFPLIALLQTVTSPSYLFYTAFVDDKSSSLLSLDGVAIEIHLPSLPHLTSSSSSSKLHFIVFDSTRKEVIKEGVSLSLYI
jgi:hypothetical protein